MGEVRCNLDWTGYFPKLVISLEAELTESQVRAIAFVVSKTVEKKLNCLLACGDQCPKETEEDEDGPGNPETQH